MVLPVANVSEMPNEVPVETPFLLGVNYWPRRKAMYWWSAFESSEVDEEFALIESLGLSIVRIFLLWDDFQPAPDRVEHIGDLRQVADLAQARVRRLRPARRGACTAPCLHEL